MDFSPSFLKRNRCCLSAVTWPWSSAPELEQDKRVKIDSCHFILDLMTLLKSSFTSGLLQWARVPLAADHNPRSSSSAYQRRNGRRHNYLDDARREMSLCARSGFAYSTFCGFLSPSGRSGASAWTQGKMSKAVKQVVL